MPFKIVRNDITKMKVDAVVNSANPAVAVGRGVDQMIYSAAGWDKLFRERVKIGPRLSRRDSIWTRNISSTLWDPNGILMILIPPEGSSEAAMTMS